MKGYLWAVMVGDAAFSLFLFLYLRPYRYFSVGACHKEERRALLCYALPLIPTTALWWVSTYSDRYILRYFHGDTPTGLLAAAGKFSLLLSFTAGIFMELWQYAALREREGARRGLFGRAFGMVLAVSFLLASGVMLLSAPVIRYLFSASYEGAEQLVPFLTLGTLFSVLSTFLGTAYQLKLRSTATLLTSLVGAALNVALNVWLIPPLGALGAATATLISCFFLFLLRLFHTSRLMAFQKHTGRWGSALGFLLFSALFLMRGQWWRALLFSLFLPLSFLPILKEGCALIFRGFSDKNRGKLLTRDKM